MHFDRQEHPSGAQEDGCEMKVVDDYHLAAAIEPIHIGVSMGLRGGARPTARDFDETPFVPATSLKGCCRANSFLAYSLEGCDGKGREYPQPHRCASCAVFGYLNFHAASEGVSLVRFSRGSLLLVPVVVNNTIFLRIEVAWPLTNQAHLFHPSPQCTWRNRTLIAFAQVMRQSLNRPDVGSVPELQWRSSQLSHNALGSDSLGRERPAAAWIVFKRRNLMLIEVKMNPVIDGLLAYT